MARHCGAQLASGEISSNACRLLRSEIKNHPTSIMAVEFDGGVVLGADSRTTTGAYIANRVTDKLTKVTDSIYCCRSGSAADTQAIADIVSYHLDFHQIELGEPPLVETAASVFRELCYSYRDSLTAGIIVAGWDKRKGGQVYTVPIGGMCVRQPISIALALAMSRDGSSGGVVRLAAITEKGVERHVVLGDQLPKFFEG
uniref:Proteasome subunit beta n=1 Tax=Timema genevievae TaxID=629358 RepID=A0A7R9PGW7_TIMGE|nr:unnamed protein product [Timema genevievae]